MIKSMVGDVVYYFDTKVDYGNAIRDSSNGHYIHSAYFQHCAICICGSVVRKNKNYSSLEEYIDSTVDLENKG
jgi:hypothetical protein